LEVDWVGLDCYVCLCMYVYGLWRYVYVYVYIHVPAHGGYFLVLENCSTLTPPSSTYYLITCLLAYLLTCLLELMIWVWDDDYLHLPYRTIIINTVVQDRTGQNSTVQYSPLAKAYTADRAPRGRPQGLLIS